MKANTGACIARQGGFGDNLIASSVLPGLKKRFGYVEVISGKPLHVMFENNPYIDKLSALEPGFPKGVGGIDWQVWYKDRGKEYEFFANLSHSCEVTGVTMPAQTAYYWPTKYRQKMYHKSYLEIVHDICDIPYDEINPNFYPTEEEKQQAEDTKAKVGGKYIGWVISGSRIDKVHPQADMMIAKIIRDLKVSVVMFGGPGKDYELAKLIQGEVKKTNKTLDGLHLAISTTPETPEWGPRRICTQAQMSDIVVGPDTGPMWAVAMHDMPKILMASHAGGHNIAAHWKNTTILEADRERVPCYPCHRLIDSADQCTPNEDKNGAACISDITVDKMVDTVKQILKET